MIPTIRSKREVTISKDLRGGVVDTGFVEVEITNISFNTVSSEWTLKVEDFKIITVEVIAENGDVETYNTRKRINVKDIDKTKEEMDILFQALGSIDSSETFNQLLATGLLGETLERPLYETSASDWEIKQ